MKGLTPHMQRMLYDMQMVGRQKPMGKEIGKLVKGLQEKKKYSAIYKDLQPH